MTEVGAVVVKWNKNVQRAERYTPSLSVIFAPIFLSCHFDKIFPAGFSIPLLILSFYYFVNLKPSRMFTFALIKSTRRGRVQIITFFIHFFHRAHIQYPLKSLPTFASCSSLPSLLWLLHLWLRCRMARTLTHVLLERTLQKIVGDDNLAASLAGCETCNSETSSSWNSSFYFFIYLRPSLASNLILRVRMEAASSSTSSNRII